MTSARLVADLTDDVVLVAFFGALFFIITYSCLASWWKHAIGTTIVMLDLGLVLTLAPSVLHRFFGLTIGLSLSFDIYFLCTLTLVAAAVWWRALVMLRINWRTRRDRRGEGQSLWHWLTSRFSASGRRTRSSPATRRAPSPSTPQSMTSTASSLT